MEGTELHVCRGMSERRKWKGREAEQAEAAAESATGIAAAVTGHHLAVPRAFIRTCRCPGDTLPVGFTNVAIVIEEDTAGSQCHEYVPDGKRRTQAGRSF